MLRCVNQPAMPSVATRALRHGSLRDDGGVDRPDSFAYRRLWLSALTPTDVRMIKPTITSRR
jgi:hypothetical protein